jgi:hypothetical protein
MQQINLYQPMFRKQQKVFSAKTLLHALFVVVAGLLLFYVYAAWKVHRLGEHQQQMSKRMTLELSRIEELNSKFPASTKNRVLEQELNRLRHEFAAKQTLVQALSGSDVGNARGFSRYFEAAARQHLDGLWLKKLMLDEGGAYISITGSALRPELVPRYLQKLGVERAYQGKNFKTFQIVRPDETGRRQIDFTLATVAQDRE